MLVEYGKMEFDPLRGTIIIACTCPIEILAKLGNFTDYDMKIIVDKQSRAFVDIPKKMFEGE